MTERKTSTLTLWIVRLVLALPLVGAAAMSIHPADYPPVLEWVAALDCLLIAAALLFGKAK